MKRDANFLLRTVAGRRVIVPVGKAVNTFPGMITVNEPGAFLWELLETPQTVKTLTRAMTDRYEVSAEVAEQDVQKFLDKLRPTGALTEE